MAEPGVIVDTINSISPAGGKGDMEGEKVPALVAVNLHSGTTAQLDMSHPNARTWAGILDAMRRARQAVYLKIDPKTGLISDLLIPRAVKVAALKTAGRKNAVEVELVVSQTRHYLKRSNPGFGSLLRILENALKTETPVLVTDSRDRQEIVDVRSVPETVSAPGYLSAPLTQLVPPKAPRAVPKEKRPRSGKGGRK